jgi:hypothetical protein
MNINMITQMVRYRPQTIEQLRAFRYTSTYCMEVVDTHVPDVWCNLLTSDEIDGAFSAGDLYLIEICLLARKWLDQDDNRKKLPFAAEVGMYDFAWEFYNNGPWRRSSTSQETIDAQIDDLFIKYGYINVLSRGRSANEMTPLIHSCSVLVGSHAGDPGDIMSVFERVRFLLEHGADPTLGCYIPDERRTKMSAFDLFVSSLHRCAGGLKSRRWVLETIDLFVSRGANPSLALLYINGPPYCIIYLIEEKHADINYRDPVSGGTPVFNEYIPIEMLLSYPNLDLEARNGDYRTVLYEALENTNYEHAHKLLLLGCKFPKHGFINSILRDANANPDMEKRERERVFCLLLQRGATIDEHCLTRGFYRKGDMSYDLIEILLVEQHKRDKTKLIKMLENMVGVRYSLRDTDCVDLFLRYGANPERIFDQIQRGEPTYQAEETLVRGYIDEQQKIDKLSQMFADTHKIFDEELLYVFIDTPMEILTRLTKSLALTYPRLANPRVPLNTKSDYVRLLMSSRR